MLGSPPQGSHGVAPPMLCATLLTPRGLSAGPSSKLLGPTLELRILPAAQAAVGGLDQKPSHLRVAMPRDPSEVRALGRLPPARPQAEKARDIPAAAEPTRALDA